MIVYCIGTLGPRWTARVIVLPGAPLVRSVRCEAGALAAAAPTGTVTAAPETAA